MLELDLVMPLFNAGARRAELTAAESRFNQARINYEKTVLTSLHEVSDGLNLFYKTSETLEALLELEAATREYLGLAEKRYRNGVLAYIDVLDARRQLFDAQIAVSNARQSQLFALVDLYRALGGGWEAVGRDYVDEDTVDEMSERTDWGDYLTPASDNGVQQR